MADKVKQNDVDAVPFKRGTNNVNHKPSQLSGMPIGPSSSSTTSSVIVRYIYDGGHLGQGRLCHLHPTEDADVPASDVIQTLCDDGVDFDQFYACAYESQDSTGGWMPLESAPRHMNPWDDGKGTNKSTLTFTIPPTDDASISRRIDVKLFRRPKAPSQTDLVECLDDVLSLSTENASENEQSQSLATVEHSSDALHAISASIPGGKMALDSGYFGIGIIAPKTEHNVGTLWRSAFQLGASVLYTIGGRYKVNSADTLNVPARIPLIELDDWNAFSEWSSPKAAEWVVIEMGGTPLSEFRHPRNAIYILGSEDHGVPKSVVRGCRHVISLESESYGSYNVAVAGSLVMYDRLVKIRKAREEREAKKKQKGEKK